MSLNPLPTPGRLPPAFIPALVVLALVFGGTLLDLARFCWSSELYSYVFLIPLVSGYLAGLRWSGPGAGGGAARPSATGPAVWLWFGGLAAVTVAQTVSLPAPEDGLCLKMLALVLWFAAVCALGLGRDRLRLLRFPLGLLAFMIPLPAAVLTGLETLSQYGSAAVANGLFTLSGIPVLQDGLIFRLPGQISFQVAPECSGLHSTVVLLITSLVAGHLMLRSWWKRALLVLVVVPLALLRNGFRIYVIGRLCIHYGPGMFQHWIHRRGGPVFFVLSLVPFFGLLIWLIKTERRGERRHPASTTPS